MEQQSFWSEEHLASLSASPESEREWMIRVANWQSNSLTLFASCAPVGSSGKMCLESSVQIKEETLEHSCPKWGNAGMGSPIAFLTLNISESHREGEESLLSDILEIGEVPQRYFLSQKACAGILRRVEARDGEMHPVLRMVLKQNAGNAE